MSEMDRRGSPRCPVCQGPMRADEGAPDGWRCRSSVCKHNHKNEVCPRCGASGDELDLTVHSDGRNYAYTCGDCQATWQRRA